jgi:hypothetical protein
MNFYYLISSLFVLIGWTIILSVSAWIYSVFQNQIALTIFVTLLASLLFFFFEKYVLGFKNVIRWKKISQKVSSELDRELNGLLADISNICGFDTAFVSNGEVSEDEIHKIVSTKIISQIQKIVKDNDAKVSEDYRALLLDGKFGILFENRKRYLEDFEIKYKEFLSTEAIMRLIDMQRALKLIDQQIIIRNKGIKNKLRFSSDEQVIEVIESQILILVNGIHFFMKEGILNYR